MSFYFRVKQKVKYYTAANSLDKRIAEINRFKPIIITKAHQFKVQGSDLLFHKEKHDFLIKQIDLFIKLDKLERLKFDIRNDVLCCSVDNLQLQVTTAEELFIINEIWVEGCYNVELNTSKPTVVIDVGMNVGYASLFFASQDKVDYVYSFEPFKPTYERGVRNLEMNPGISNKITAHNIGLSSHDAEVAVDYSLEHRGRTGVWGTELVLDKIEATTKESLVLKSFNEQVSKIIKNHHGCHFVWKIDCEGSEYDIFKIMDTTLLQNVKAILLEWHSKGPALLNELLKENSFSTLVFNPMSSKVGMLYAFK